jgi:hypothetical protein
VLRDDIGGPLAKRVIRHVVDGRADHRKARGQQPLLGQVVDRGQELLAAQIAGGAEDDHDRRLGNPIVVQALRERVGLGLGDCVHFRAASAFASETTA